MFWVGSATLFNLLVWVVAGKVMAVMLGPAGVGMYGLLRQFAQNLNVVATFNGSTTLVQGIASRPAEERTGFARNVAKIFLGLGLGIGLALLLIGPGLATRLLGREVPPALLRWMIVPLIGMSLASFFLGMLNGYRHIKALVICQALGPLVALALIYPCVWWIRGGGTWAYALILGAPYAVIGLAGGVVSYRKGWFAQAEAGRAHSSFGRDGRQFFGLSSALLIGGLAGTGVQLFVNGLVVRKLGMAESGQFWVAWSLSMTYVTVLLSSLGAYYLPSLSATRDPEAKKQLILTFTRVVLMFMPILITLVVILKAPGIRLLFSPKLLPSLRVFRWMLIGDLLKVLSWVWAFPMLAFAEGKTFLLIEVANALVWVVLAWLGFNVFHDIEFLGQLFCGVYLLYAGEILIYLWLRHRIRLPFGYWMHLARGMFVVGFASFLFWDRTTLPPVRVIFALVPAILNLWACLIKSERKAILSRLSIGRLNE